VIQDVSGRRYMLDMLGCFSYSPFLDKCPDQRTLIVRTL
jgi:hypothetical protein